MSVFEMAIELGKKLSTTPEYAKVQEAQAAVRENPEARKLVRDFQDLQKAYQRMQMMGHQLTKENVEELAEMERQASEHPLVRAYLDAQNDFYNVVNIVNLKIQEGLTGISADDEDEPQPEGSCGCSSNDSGACGSCSGC